MGDLEVKTVRSSFTSRLVQKSWATAIDRTADAQLFLRILKIGLFGEL
jgi:hypothetical protein